MIDGGIQTLYNFFLVRILHKRQERSGLLSPFPMAIALFRRRKRMIRVDLTSLFVIDYSHC